MKNNTFIITENDEGRRIDRIIRKMFPAIPLSRIYKAFRKGEIRLNKKKVKPDTTTRCGDTLFISGFFTPGVEDEQNNEPVTGKRFNTPAASAGKNDLGSLILFENNHILALNKPAGLLVHGENSLEEGVKAYVSQLIPRSLSFKPGPLHRLDRNTSGLIFFSKSIKGARILSDLFKKKICEKYYLGLFDGKIENETEWRDRVYRDKKMKKTYPAHNREAPEAITKIKPLFVVKRKTLALCMIHTGITHQIRAQGMIHGHPLTGDKKYGSRIPSGYQGHYILHSWGIRFLAFNITIGRTSLFAPLPQKLYKKLKSLCGHDHFKTTLSRARKRILHGI